MSKQNLFSNLTKKDGELVYNIKAQEKIYNTFVDDLPEGSKVEIFVSVSGDNGTNAQIAKIHVMIRQLANDIGYSFGEMNQIFYEWKENEKDTLLNWIINKQPPKSVVKISPEILGFLHLSFVNPQK